jgi:hypothetical protein
VSLLHAVNPIVRRLLRIPVARGLRNQVMVVDVTGRRTGRRYSIPLSAHQIDGTIYAMTSAPWKHNFRDGKIPAAAEFAAVCEREQYFAIRFTRAGSQPYR